MANLIEKWDKCIYNFVKLNYSNIPKNKIKKIEEYITKYFVPTMNNSNKYTINPMYSNDHLSDEKVEEINFVLNRLNYYIVKEEQTFRR